jgi:hypothetical protein
MCCTYLPSDCSSGDLLYQTCYMLTVNCMRSDILQIILSGEARRPRQIVKVLNSEGKVIAYAKPRCPMVNYYLIFIICLISAEPVSILVPLQCPFHLFFF